MYTNALIHETSPYLLQHAHNPVNWHPWGPQVLDLARKEHKLLLISIGYAACHWCHVMAHESFEDPEVAQIMNRHYICVKVDREERPDVDQIYMNAALLVSGNGGWPLNAFAMPDGKPFYAGTYYPKEKWKEVLSYFAMLQQKEPHTLQQQAAYLSNGISQIELIPKNETPVSRDADWLGSVFGILEARVDPKFGGMSGSIKFPMPSIWEFLLQYHHFSGDPVALERVTLTLDHMAMGGIYDQIGGGFSRYSTDPYWHAPHFEKMLYDNAQLVSLYSHAFQLTGKPLYKRIVYETIAFIKRELTSPEGGFFSSLDADSQGEEGRYYVWKQEEIEETLGSDASIFMEAYGIRAKGNWESGYNIPDLLEGNRNVAEKYGLSEAQFAEKIGEMGASLLQVREERIRPATDDKILSSWNALMTKGLLDAYQAFGERDFLVMAQQNFRFLSQHLGSAEGGLHRSYRDGRSAIPGFLDDYAQYIQSLIGAYQVTFDQEWLERAQSVTEYVIIHFYDPDSGMFFYTEDRYSDLIARKMEVADNVIPASNSVMAGNLFWLAALLDQEKFHEIASQQLNNVLEEMKKSPSEYSYWAQMGLIWVRPPYEVAIVGPDWKSKLKEFQKHYLPEVIYLGGPDEGSLSLLKNKVVPGKTMVYVCRDKTCQKPTEDVKEALDQLKH